jgi:hypothetical protein
MDFDVTFVEVQTMSDVGGVKEYRSETSVSIHGVVILNLTEIQPSVYYTDQLTVLAGVIPSDWKYDPKVI